MYNLYNSYFVTFENFVNVVIFGFYIFIYYSCRSLTRVGVNFCFLGRCLKTIQMGRRHIILYYIIPQTSARCHGALRQCSLA